MINYVMVGTNGFYAAAAFYDALMTDMGATRAYSTEKNRPAHRCGPVSR
jgi:hypothetical protein